MTPSGARRLSILAIVVLAGATLAFLGFRASSRTRESASLPPAPILSADIPLERPPPLPPDDRLRVLAGLRQARALQTEARAKGNDPAAHLQTAQAATPVGDLISAIDEINTAIRLKAEPPPAPIIDALASCRTQLGLFSAALDDYRDLIARAPDDATGYLGLSRIRFLLGQRKEALQALEDGTKAVPFSNLPGRLALASEFEARAEPHRALMEAQAVFDSAPSEPASGAAVARLLAKLGRLSEARALLEKLLAAQPDNAEALDAMADLRLNPLLPHNDPKTLEHALLQAGEHHPHSVRAHMRLGGYYQERGLFRQAAYVYSRLLRFTPDSAAARLQLAYAYARLGDRSTAAEQERLAVKLLARDKEQSLLTARRDAQPTYSAPRLALARHYVGTGRFALALIELQAASCLSPESPTVRRELAAFYKQLGVPPHKPRQ